MTRKPTAAGQHIEQQLQAQAAQLAALVGAAAYELSLEIAARSQAQPRQPAGGVAAGRS
jgi:hypothetical protein